MTTLLAYSHLSFEIALRIGATLAVTIVFANIFLAMIARLNSRVGNLAIIDPLTGAYNRRFLESSIQRPVELKKRYGTPMSVLLIDVDHFKQINDGFGHAAGDTVLRDIADRLRSSLRTIDYLFRVGGEEFLVLLPESRLDGAQHVAEKLRSAIAAQPMIGNRQVTISIGAGELEADEESRDLFKRCDDALYQAKSQGRNQVCVSSGSPSG
ncbi:MAG: GGDEF domain-containing protein, partial [Gammaproteobacteria bacterium]|nr:GGDEF domain-containing protein [Gammaproteobacteria bacterium]